MKKLLVIPLLSAVLLSGCMTLPVNGRLGDDRFLGSATGYLHGAGTLYINSINGDTCTGEFAYTSRATSGLGTFKCESGKTGNFHFTSDGRSGRGFGKTTDGEEFNFNFGHPTARVEQW